MILQRFTWLPPEIHAAQVDAEGSRPSHRTWCRGRSAEHVARLRLSQ